jgi:hypothetical protein
MAGKKGIYRVSSKDSIEDAIDKNEKLIAKIGRLEREIKKLRSSNRTIKDIWTKTEEYLLAISEEKSLKEIFSEIDTKTSLRKVKKKCPSCSNKQMNKRHYDGYYVISCDCGYRNRVDERGSSKIKTD